MFPMTFPEFIQYMLTPEGIGAAVGVLVYVLVEYTELERRLDPKGKRAIVFLLSVFLPLPFSYLRIPFGVIEAPATGVEFWNVVIWPALQSGAIAFATSQIVHMRHLKARAKAV